MKYQCVFLTRRCWFCEKLLNRGLGVKIDSSLEIKKVVSLHHNDNEFVRVKTKLLKQIHSGTNKQILKRNHLLVVSA